MTALVSIQAESVDDVKFTPLLSVVLVILVIFLFLRNVSATIIPEPCSGRRSRLSEPSRAGMALRWASRVDNLSLMALDAWPSASWWTMRSSYWKTLSGTWKWARSAF